MDIAKIRKVYDGFAVKNISFQEFARRIQGLSDPGRMRRDLDEIELRKARERTNRIRIDRAANR